MNETGNIIKAATGADIGTVIKQEERNMAYQIVDTSKEKMEKVLVLLFLSLNKLYILMEQIL